MQTQPLEAPSRGTWKQTVNTALTNSEARPERLERRLELELGAGGDHDTPYRFAWPGFLPQALAWIRLMRQVRQREETP